VTPDLVLLDEPSWAGSRIVGDRSVELLAALVLAGAAGLGVDALIDDLWPDEPPANGAKALQVVVSRARKATDPSVIERTAHGYRLGTAAVDAVGLATAVAQAERSLRDGSVRDAIDTAQAALAVAVSATEGPGLLSRLREQARAARQRARRVLALALAQGGAPGEALPELERVAAVDPADEEVLAALLLAESSVRGAPAALDRYEAIRIDRADRLGVDPGDALRRVHQQLLAADRPLREGVRFDADDLVGRTDDLQALLGLLASHRVVTILGPGGIGKTRMAHLVARHAPEPVVHVVELVGVRSGDDVVSEVGSALGVRDSVTSVRALTPAQRADLRTRVAAQLDRVPSLLVLDNCEHVVDEAAALVAYLVATTRDVRVLTTSRSPLAIAAEHAYPLSQLELEQASHLFRMRAQASRPSVVLDPDEVRRVVARLDGLPLAIELAAAKVRSMSVAEIDRRLERRFELLRGNDRSAPDRHRTLLAVIDWSWGLLTERQRVALRRLSVFSDGFTLAAAEAVLGATCLDDVPGIVDQSLLAVTEQQGRVRYRMLETVREFGQMHLIDAGEDTEAALAQRAWATAFVDGAIGEVFSERQVEALARLTVEETTLSDVLRRAVADGDTDAVVAVGAALTMLWTIRGEHGRALAISGPVDALLADYDPPPALADASRMTAIALILPDTFMGGGGATGSRAMLQRIGGGDNRRICFTVEVIALALSQDPASAQARLDELTQSPERQTRLTALQWAAHLHENRGDGRAATGLVERALALWRPEDGMWMRVNLEMQLAQLAGQRGDLEVAARHAREALPDLLLIGAIDDAMDARSLVALDAIRRGDLTLAEEMADANTTGTDGVWSAGGATVTLAVRAEVALARGDIDLGLRTYREMATAMARPVPEFGVMIAFFALYGLANAAAAHAFHGQGEDLFDELATLFPTAVDADPERIDFPLIGAGVFALGAAGALHGRLDPDDAAFLVCAALRFNYVRASPSMDWQVAVDAIEKRRPGAILRAEERLGDRQGPDLLPEVHALIATLVD
jgi:predicted ATPase/DNA-binding SARP family transcriptional activator